MKKTLLASMIAVPALTIGAYAIAQTASPASTPTSAVAPDNTKSNKIDPSDHGTTADKQGNGATDIDLAKRIRQSVMSDNSLSTYGHNVKIVAVNGTVTLNGVVRNAAEKEQISKKATSIAGAGHVIDALKVASSN
jgi:hyperosmotically inducible protein